MASRKRLRKMVNKGYKQTEEHKKNIGIATDGNYWHKYPIGLEKDHIRTKELIEKGFKVLRLWESEIKDMNLNNFKEKMNHGIL